MSVLFVQLTLAYASYSSYKNLFHCLNGTPKRFDKADPWEDVESGLELIPSTPGTIRGQSGLEYGPIDSIFMLGTELLFRVKGRAVAHIAFTGCRLYRGHSHSKSERKTLFHSYRTVAIVVDTEKVFLRHLNREDLLRELLAFHRLIASIPVMPLFYFPIRLRICLMKTSLRLVIPCLTKEKSLLESTGRESLSYL
ncbi:hypothetical protein PVK06_047579 [Gossypium arboreum]|uniref:Uncharacterized protein n=1 Tax=Gossypium arboreum TaxID=29729 RepID=A0ABR0MFL1_GOSAR|nr:hypothetical protein PVK06_047579 [Gossypium arboreum]